MILHLTKGQDSDNEGAKYTFASLPPDARTNIADRGYDADWRREALAQCKITACVPPRCNRLENIPYAKTVYKRRNLVERMFGRLKGWRRIAMRHDRCAHTFMSAICIAATVIFWL